MRNHSCIVQVSGQERVCTHAQIQTLLCAHKPLVCVCTRTHTPKKKDPGKYLSVKNYRLYQNRLCKHTTPINTSTASTECLSLKNTSGTHTYNTHTHMHTLTHHCMSGIMKNFITCPLNSNLNLIQY